jgi:hypothetical protein
MKQPIHITVDPTCSLGYIEYRDEDEWVRTHRILRRDDGTVGSYTFDERPYEPTGVHADLNDDGDVVAIEIICIDDAQSFAVAREYAAQRGLAFPEDFRAAAAAGDPAA